MKLYQAMAKNGNLLRACPTSKTAIARQALILEALIAGMPDGKGNITERTIGVLIDFLDIKITYAGSSYIVIEVEVDWYGKYLQKHIINVTPNLEFNFDVCVSDDSAGGFIMDTVISALEDQEFNWI